MDTKLKSVKPPKRNLRSSTSQLLRPESGSDAVSRASSYQAPYDPGQALRTTGTQILKKTESVFLPIPSTAPPEQLDQPNKMAQKLLVEQLSKDISTQDELAQLKEQQAKLLKLLKYQDSQQIKDALRQNDAAELLLIE